MRYSIADFGHESAASADSCTRACAAVCRPSASDREAGDHGEARNTQGNRRHAAPATMRLACGTECGRVTIGHNASALRRDTRTTFPIFVNSQTKRRRDLQTRQVRGLQPADLRDAAARVRVRVQRLRRLRPMPGLQRRRARDIFNPLLSCQEMPSLVDQINI